MENVTEENNDDDEEEEEVIVYANFEEGSVSSEIFRQGDLKFKVIGLESDTPIVQLGETTFKGTWNDTVGTKVFFEEDFSPEQVDPVFTVLPPKMLKYKCKSTKTLELSRIFLKPKATEDQMKDENPMSPFTNMENSIFGEHEGEVMNIVNSTMIPDSNTNTVMSEIVDETVMELVE